MLRSIDNLMPEYVHFNFYQIKQTYTNLWPKIILCHPIFYFKFHFNYRYCEAFWTFYLYIKCEQGTALLL